MNVRDIVIAPHRRAFFSTSMRTGTFKDGKLTKGEPGAYRFGYVKCCLFGVFCAYVHTECHFYVRNRYYITGGVNWPMFLSLQWA